MGVPRGYLEQTLLVLTAYVSLIRAVMDEEMFFFLDEQEDVAEDEVLDTSSGFALFCFFNPLGFQIFF